MEVGVDVDVDKADGSENENENESETEKKQNLVIILQWRIRSMFHLCRFNDAKLFIERMNLTCTKFCNGQVPTWIPLSLILQSMECVTFYYQKKAKAENNINNNSNSNSNNSVEEGEEKEECKGIDEILDEFYNLRRRIFVAVQNSNENDGGNLIFNDNDNDNGNDNGNRETTWKNLLQLDIILSNILTRNQEWRLALLTLENIIGYAEDVAAFVARKTFILGKSGSSSVSIRNATHIMNKSILIEMFSRQGRVLLQAGALPAAATVFERAHDEFQELESSGILEKVARKGSSSTSSTSTNTRVGNDWLSEQKIVKNIPTQILLNEGLLHFAHMDYDLAEIKFNNAIQIQRKEQGEELNLDEEGRRDLQNTQLIDRMVDTEGDLLVPCLNNFALCALYTCRMREAITLMEALIREDPTRYLTHCIVFNLCTLYELGWDNTMSDKKKQVLQLVAKRFSLHDIGAESFRLN